MIRSTHYPFVNRRNPEAAGVCDRGGEVRPYRELKKEMVWAGTRLIWNGFLCCDHHRDKPQPLDRTFIVPVDPVPIRNPRPLLPMVPVPGETVQNVPDIQPIPAPIVPTAASPYYAE